MIRETRHKRIRPDTEHSNSQSRENEKRALRCWRPSKHVPLVNGGAIFYNYAVETFYLWPNFARHAVGAEGARLLICSFKGQLQRAVMAFMYGSAVTWICWLSWRRIFIAILKFNLERPLSYHSYTTLLRSNNQRLLCSSPFTSRTCK